MAEAYIVESLRTAGGRRKGGFAGIHPADLGANVLDALVQRTCIDPAAVEVGSSRVDLQACKLEYSIVSPK